jgi:type IV pilus modification protein PilV
MRMERKKGFSLIEVMVALTILIVGVLAVTSLLLQSIQSSATVPNRLIAISLAEETMEIVRNKRDSDFLSNNIFEVYDTSPDCMSGGCVVGYSSNCIDVGCSDFDGTNCTNASLPRVIAGVSPYDVKYISNIGYFQTDAALCASTNSIFTRNVTINETAPDIIEVCVNVSWSDPGFHNFSLCETFSDPQPS